MPDLTDPQQRVLSRIRFDWTDVSGQPARTLRRLKEAGLIEHRVLAGVHHRARRIEEKTT